MQWARSAFLGAAAVEGAAEELEHGGDGDRGFDGVKVDERARSDSGLTRMVRDRGLTRAFVSGLANLGAAVSPTRAHPSLVQLEDRLAPSVTSIRTIREATAAGPEANAQVGIQGLSDFGGVALADGVFVG